MPITRYDQEYPSTVYRSIQEYIPSGHPGKRQMYLELLDVILARHYQAARYKC